MALDIDDVVRFVSADHGLATLATTRADGGVQLTLVNAGVTAHPTSGDRVVGLVAVGGTRKLANLRERPRASLSWRDGWQWLTVEGTAQLVGPDDDGDGVDVRQLLRDVFTGAGGTHDDWDTYDRTMAEERRTAVLITPARVYGS